MADSDSSLKYIVAAATIGACIGNMFVARKMRSISKWRAPTKGSSRKKEGEWQIPSPSNRYENSHINESNYRANVHAKYNSGSGASNPFPTAGNMTNVKHTHSAHTQEFISCYKNWKSLHKFRSDVPAAARPRFAPSASSSASASFGFDVTGADMTHYLKLLNLDQTRLPSKKEVQEAYRVCAVRLHPDSSSSSSSSSSSGSSSNNNSSKREEFTKSTDAYDALLDKLKGIEANMDKHTNTKH